MTEWVEFPNFITKGIEIEKSNRRILTGHITAEIIDRQQEFIFVKEVLAIMKNFMEVNPVISDFHSNRMVGRVLDYEKSEYQGVPTVKITAEIYKKDGVTLYDKVWEKVLKSEYTGFSMGGASKEREPIMKDGRMALELKKLELYEIALCPTPANPFAIIEKVNMFAKTAGLEDKMIKEEGGRQYIQCTSIGCRFEKGTNMDVDIDIDNHQHEYVCVGKDVCDICGISKEEHGLEQFDKPTEKGVGDAKSLVGRSAQTRSDSIGESAGSPKEVNDMINQISAGKMKKDYVSMGNIPAANKNTEVQKEVMDAKIKDRNITKDHIPSMTEGQEAQARGKIEGGKTGSRTISESKDIHDESNNPAEHQQSIEDKMHRRSIEVHKIAPIVGAIVKPLIESAVVSAASSGDEDVEKQTVPEDKPKQWNEKKEINAYIEQFGKENVRKALEEIDTIDHLKSILNKYKSN